VHDEPYAADNQPEQPIDRREFYPAAAFGDIIDRSLQAATARLTCGLSPASLAAAYLDWATHLAFSPGKQLHLVEKTKRKAHRFATYAWRTALKSDKCGKAIEPLPQDRRFRGEAWQQWPFNLIHQAFLLHQQWWYNATVGVRGVSKQHEAMAEFVSRQILDMVSPSNFLLTNPDVLRRTLITGGMNLATGLRYLLEDWERAASGKKPADIENFKVGRDIAITPGKVVYRNRLMELIQYAPTTDTVRPEPILMVSAWIMKYYILDLSPQNSLIRYLTEQGFTVFVISWLNPSARDRELGIEHYRTLGVMTAIEAIGMIVPDCRIHALGYCLGGTLLSIAAAAMARDGDERLKSITLLAAQTDFKEAGELTLFINESQLTFLEDMMWNQGFLDHTQMAGTFQILHSNDLIWSYMIRNYLMGEREPIFDLMAWNADGTRLPYRMHSEYLQRLFLHNDLAEGRFLAAGKPIALCDIRAPIFTVATTADHIAPWRSAYKINLLTDTEVTFLLTTGGHNAGIISPPSGTNHKFQVMTSQAHDRYVDPEQWLARAAQKQGSWWPEWVDWLRARSGIPVEPPAIGIPANPPPLVDAPGSYVLMR
jgi:polyhydroxyalkanoate synthase